MTSTAQDRTGLPLDAPGTCCPPAAGAVLDTAAAERLAGVLKAVAEPTRLRLLSLVAAAQGGQACICDLTDPVGLSQPTVSHHMKSSSTPGSSNGNSAAGGPTSGWSLELSKPPPAA